MRNASQNRAQPPLPSLSNFLDRPGYAEALVCIVAFLTYAASLGFGFVNDDRLQVVANQHIRSWAAVPGYFTHHVWAGLDAAVIPNYYRPFFYVVFRLEYALFGLHTLGWHLVNVGVHVVATWLVFCFARRLLDSRIMAFVSALLFAVHPVHVESVAWISGITDPLMTVLLLASAIAFLRWNSGDGARWYGWSLLFGALALLTKETAAVLPLIVAAAAYAGYRDNRMSWGRIAKSTLPFVALTAVYLAVRQIVLHGFSHTASNLTVTQMVLTWPKILGFYLRQLIFPYSISPYYDMAPVSTASSLGFLLPLALLIALALAFAWALWRSKRRAVLVNILAWTLLPILPVLYVLVFDPGELVHDRYLYASTVGVCLLAALLLQRLSESLRSLWPPQRLQIVVVAILAVLLVAVTLPNEYYYANDLALFSRAVQQAPGSDVAVINLGTVLMEHGQFARGMQMYQILVNRNPDNAMAHYNLGRAEYSLGHYSLAKNLIGRAIALDPRHPEWWLMYAGTEVKLGKYPQAEASVRRALELNPTGPDFHVALGAILLAKGDREGAAAAFRKELEIHPGDPRALQGLAQLQSQ